MTPNESLFRLTRPSPIGELTLVATDAALVGLFMEAHASEPLIAEAEAGRTPVLKTVSAQLDDYFAGRRERFDVPLAPRGTAFQTSVWAVLQRIPFGVTWSYAQVARALGRPKAVRAVGAANGRNPISLIIPCHRVIGADGSLTGYGGGLPRKRWLLAHEKTELSLEHG
ncbi:MAG: methylated-DNA--[protein]-cysteine S-methyltransferase [Myxococcales bacterium]|nr:methylated-DNA--[protein]-cysteine S-methyltransferase [Myxococcales bacterium]